MSTTRYSVDRGDTIFQKRESNVRSYCRSFPVVFKRAKGALLYSESNQRFIDFFCGAGALNYGHNNDRIKNKIIEYLQTDCVIHALDMFTDAKRTFLETFTRRVLEPRTLDYKVQFCGPTGTNAIEAALKLARKVTGRAGIFAFMGGFHGMSLGGLSVSGNLKSRAGAGIPLSHATFIPFAYGEMSEIDSIKYIDAILSDSHSGVEKPAAILLETVQAEGGVVIAPEQWLRELRSLCDRHGILMICDDIQVGCYRTGSFFSFERAGIIPDMVVLSKSISGYGMPMSVLLFHPQLDLWEPGEHTGTFRGNQLAFIGGAEALELAHSIGIEVEVKRKGKLLSDFLTSNIPVLNDNISIRGIGMIWGIDFSNCGGSELASKVSRCCFDNGLIVETAGREDAVVKLIPSLTIEQDLLEEGCEILYRCIEECVNA